MGHSIIKAEDINIFDAEQIKGIRENLLHFSENDHDAFSKQSLEFFKALGVPALKAEKGDEKAVNSFINGQPMFKINDTTEQQYAEVKQKALDSHGLWNALPLQARQDFFKTLDEICEKYKPAIDLAITLEVGKAGSEFSKMREWYKWGYANDDVTKALSGSGEITDLSHKDSGLIITYQMAEAKGVGISGGTCGFNYPDALIKPDITASRLTGNAFIGKTVSKAPSSMFIAKRMEAEALDLMAQRTEDYKWYAAAAEAGVDIKNPETLQKLKDGFGIISGRGVFNQWVQDCDTFRLVGSATAGEVALKLREKVDPKLERTILELAGNNPVVVMDSAKELNGGLQRVVNEIADGNKSNSGQRCTSPRRWMVHSAVYDEFKELAKASYESTAENAGGEIGNPLDAKTKVGAMDKGGFKEAQEYLAKARYLGAEVIGGKRILQDKFPDAYYMTPALVIWDNVPAKERDLMHEKEVFAPIANLVKVKDLKRAIKLTNMSDEKLSGAVYTNHEYEFEHFSKMTDLGSCLLNMAPKDQSPTGVHAGKKRGGMGETGGIPSLKHYHRGRASVVNNGQRAM